MQPQITGLEHRQIHDNTLERNPKGSRRNTVHCLPGMPTSIFCL
jgi:hypothetical protein